MRSDFFYCEKIVAQIDIEKKSNRSSVGLFLGRGNSAHISPTAVRGYIEGLCLDL
jgi:hypothetical protein